MNLSVVETCKLARDNVSYPANLSTAEKNKMLDIIANALVSEKESIISANKADVLAAEKANMAAHTIDRLSLNSARIDGMAQGVRDLIKLDDPIGTALGKWENYVGLNISRVRVPLGVIGIIYEARPNVTSDTIAICLKTGNAIVLRGSKDAYNSNKTIVDVIKSALSAAGYNSEFIQLISDTSREGASEFMRMAKYIDVLVPRGSANLINTVKDNSNIPIIETGAGNCHEYIESTADYEMAKEILINGKFQRPSVCNALESLLIDENIAAEFLPKLVNELQERNATIYGCDKTVAICGSVNNATEEDFYKEYNALALSIKVVSGVAEAIDHINKHSTHHSDVIVTNNQAAAAEFLQKVDSAAVYVNASTRFTDGGEFGFGAELGISTQKLHARGPIGLEQLTSMKYQIVGNGQIRK